MTEFSGKRILVLEDEPLVAFALEDMLLELGCEVVGPANTLAQAAELANTQTIDAAVLDINIDGERSYGIAELLAAKGVPHIFATGYNPEDLPFGAAGVLTKPYRASDVEAALAKALK